MGRDRRGNNLGVYEDGGVFCFSCSYSIAGSRTNRIHSLDKHSNNREPNYETKGLGLPNDSSSDIAPVALRWLSNYGISNTEIIVNRFLWSDYREQLIYPIFGNNSELLAYQARNFGKDAKTKYFTAGNVKEVYHILGGKERVCQDGIVLVEDLLSAIKVARRQPAMPLFGNEVANRLKSLRVLTDKLTIWLDPNMKRKMIIEASRAQGFGFNVTTVFSDKDPKEHTDKEIEEYLTG